MKVIFSEKHKLRDAKFEVSGGVMVYPFERPARMDFIMARLKERGFQDIIPPKEFPMAAVNRIHQKDFTDFLENGYDEWKAAGFEGDMICTGFLARRMVERCPNYIDGKLGYYALSTETAISKGTWQAALASKDVALTGSELIRSGKERVVFSLCRPPGHHATVDMFGGYCFLNNIAIAAQFFLDQGAKKIAILDVDFHHGNGTQDIFYERDDVLFVSLHGRPEDAYPYFLGYEDELGKGKGLGFNRNYAMPPKTNYAVWGSALKDGLKLIKKFGAEVLLVSLGVDTFEKDPISFFKLTSADYITMGREIAAIGLPTQIVMEGGYAVEEIGINTVNFLEGFEDGAKKP